MVTEILAIVAMPLLLVACYFADRRLYRKYGKQRVGQLHKPHMLTIQPTSQRDAHRKPRKRRHRKGN
jgi:hypothetical protein